MSLRLLPKVASCASLLSQLISALSRQIAHIPPTPGVTAQKLTIHIGLLRRLAGSSWVASARTLRIATLALIHSAAEYCAPVQS